jgi:hypothetical protein
LHSLSHTTVSPGGNALSQGDPRLDWPRLDWPRLDWLGDAEFCPLSDLMPLSKRLPASLMADFQSFQAG